MDKEIGMSCLIDLSSMPIESFPKRTKTRNLHRMKKREDSREARKSRTLISMNQSTECQISDLVSGNNKIDSGIIIFR